MKGKYLITVLLFVVACNNLCGQNTSFYSDTLAFRQYLSDNFGTRANAKAIFQLYQRLSKTYTKEEREQRFGQIGSPSDSRSFSADYGFVSSHEFHPSNNSFSWSTQPGDGRVDNFMFPDSLRMRLRKETHEYARGRRDREADKEALIRALAAFDSVTINKPIFFADIYTKFKGNYRKYVNRLYKKSILLNGSRMMKFTLHPTRKKLQADLGVQFVIGLALYESWIKDVREGCVMAECRE